MNRPQSLTVRSSHLRPETRYARSGDARIAYQVIGDGPIDLLLVPWFVSHVEAGWEEPNLAWFLSRLASFARLIIFDKRGTGLSDPVTRIPTIEQRVDEVRAVLDAVGSETATIFGASEGGTLSVLFARAHPERARALILYGSWARRIACQGYPWGMHKAELHDLLDHMSSAWATGEWWTGPPVSLDDERHRRWWARYLRMSASPSMARDVIRMNASIDVRDALPDLQLPVLVLHRAADSWVDIGHARFLAAQLPCARYVELPDTDHRLWVGDTATILDEIRRFLVGPALRSRRRVTAARVTRSRAAS